MSTKFIINPISQKASAIDMQAEISSSAYNGIISVTCIQVNNANEWTCI